MPEYEGSNSSRSTGPSRTSRSSRSSSLPELRFFQTDQSVLSTPIKELSDQGDDVSTQIHYPLSDPTPNLPKESGFNDSKYMLDCCSPSMCLVTLQILVGITIIVLAITMLLMSPSVSDRDAPYWAGIVLLLTGGMGLYFNAIKRGIYERSRRGVFIKIAFFSLSVVCLFTSSIASAFCGIQTSLISTILSLGDSSCQTVDHDCVCTRTIDEELTRRHVYEHVLYCRSFLINLRTYMYLQCALNSIGAITAFSTALLMWRRRYAEFHSGLRFYSYSAALPSRPWEDRNKPHYMESGTTCVNGNVPNGGPVNGISVVKDTPHR